MNGVIKTYLPEKRYGFIKGDDGKDYFFHEADFTDKTHIKRICEEAVVKFDQQATAKGYKAKNCSLVNPAEVLTYVIPDEFITTKTSTPSGWDVIELGAWTVRASSGDSPESAKKYLIDRAKLVGANALIELEYYKTTGSKGNYRYSIHNYRARVVTLAKRNSLGKYTSEQLLGLNKRSADLKKTLSEQTKRSRKVERNTWVTIVVLSLLFVFIDPRLIIILLIIGFFVGRSSDFDSWLEPVKG